MAIFNTCTPIGPANTPINEDNELVFTQDVHGFNYTLENATQWFDNVNTLPGNQTSTNIVQTAIFGGGTCPSGACSSPLSGGCQRYRLSRLYSHNYSSTFSNLHPQYTEDDDPIYGADWFLEQEYLQDPFGQIWKWEKGVCECEEIKTCRYMCGSCSDGGVAVPSNESMITFTCDGDHTCGQFPCGPQSTIYITVDDFCDEACPDGGYGTAVMEVSSQTECELVWNDIFSIPYTDEEGTTWHGTSFSNPGFKYIGGCPPSDVPAPPTPNICFGSDDQSYIDQVCSQDDCSGIPFESCRLWDNYYSVFDYSECSAIDNCGQCVCGQYSMEIGEIENCIDPETAAENCNLDCNGDPDGSAYLDDCGECTGGNSPNVLNHSDLGCGCHFPGPETFYLDQDFDCNPSNFNPSTDCTVTESSARLFCRSVTNNPTSNTCAFEGSDAGTTDCLPIVFNPYQWIACTPGADCEGISDDSPTGTSGQPQIGCTDSNAIECDDPTYTTPPNCYNPTATHGYIPQFCDYEHDIGDVIIRHNFTEYLIGDEEQTYWVECLDDDTTEVQPMTYYPIEDADGYHQAICHAGESETIKYNFYVNNGTDDIYDNITHDTIINKNIPTYIGFPTGDEIKYFYDYEGQFNDRGTNLPLITIDTIDNNILAIRKGEIDELNFLIDDPVDTFEISYTQLSHWNKYNYDITSTEDYQLESIGMDGINNWYLDGLYNDKTSIKKALAYDLWRQMDVSYTIDYRFVDLTVNSRIQELERDINEYRGVHLLTEKITPESVGVPTSGPEQITITEYNAKSSRTEVRLESMPFVKNDIVEISGETAMGEANDAALSASHYNGTWQVCKVDDDEIHIKSLCIGPEVVNACDNFDDDDDGIDDCYEADYEFIGLFINTQSNCEAAPHYGTWLGSSANCEGIEPNNDIHPDADHNLEGVIEKATFGTPFFSRYHDGFFDDEVAVLPPLNEINIDIPSFTRFMLLNELALSEYTSFVVYSPTGETMYFSTEEDFSDLFTRNSQGDNAAGKYSNPINKLDLSYIGDAYSFQPSEIAEIRTTHWSEISTAWNELRGDIFNIENVHNRIDYYYNYLKKSMFIDNKRWNYFDEEIYEIYEDTINSFKEWIKNRINYIDIRYPNFDCCNDPDTTALNYDNTCNFNGGNCNYSVNKTITFELDTTYVNQPPVERVELEILKKTTYVNGSYKLTPFNKKYDLEKIRDNSWSITLPADVTYTFPTGYDYDNIQPGATTEYRFVKHVPSVYSVESGAIEYDKSRFILTPTDHERDIILSHYFNDFIDTFERTNLPIIKIDTINYNDMGWVDENNPNLWYCPGYINEREIIDGWNCEDFADAECDTQCINQVNYINGEDSSAGYYSNKGTCEINTGCTVDCMDGTNLWDEPKVSGWMDLIYDGEDTIHHKNDIPQLSTKIGIEARGFSSRGFPKKQYSIETQQIESAPQCDSDNANYNLFCNGFSPEESDERNEDCLFTIENDFVLLGPYRDRVYIRNALTYELWYDMGNPSSNSKFVEFVLNDVYQGIFVVFEKPKEDEYRMNVGDDTLECESEICGDTGDDFSYLGVDYCCTGGYIVKIESGGEQEYFVMDDGFTKVEYYDPDEWKSGGEVEKAFINYKVNTATTDTTMLDTPSFVDYFISQELAQNNEGYTRSQYWMMNDGDYNTFYQGYVWDMNHAYGAVLDYSSYWSFIEFFAVGDVWKDFISANEPAIYDSWIDYRSNILDVNNLLERIDNISNPFKEYNSIVRDSNRWFYSNNQDYDDEFSKFKGWLFSRIAFIDATMCNIDNVKSIYNFTSNNTLDDCTNNNCGFNTMTAGWPGSVTSVHPDGSAHETIPMTDCIWSNPEDWNKTFLHVISPEDNKIFEVKNTKFIEFSWVSSVDLWLLAHYTDSDDSGNWVPTDHKGEGVVTFEIKDSITREVIYTFTSTDLSGFTKFKIPSYTWKLSKYEDITGSYYIQGFYSYYTNTTGTWDVQTVYSNKSYFSIESKTVKEGCTDSLAINYNEFAILDDETCKYQTDCDEKYLIQRTDLQTIRTFNISSGYNIISYPFAYALEAVEFFDVLNKSYTAWDIGGFSEFDSVTTQFDGKLYSATYIDGNWKSTNSDGLTINNIEPGMGIILETANSGIISWTLPTEEVD